MAHIKKYYEGDSTGAKSTENSDDKETTCVTSDENCNRQTICVTSNENYSDKNYSDENYVTRSGRVSHKPTNLTDYCLSWFYRISIRLILVCTKDVKRGRIVVYSHILTDCEWSRDFY